MMILILEILVASLYFISLTFLFAFSLGQLHLTWHYLKNKKDQKSGDSSTSEILDWPKVTVQLPVYNEKYVAERLIKNVCQLNYPIDKLQIQVLDDSTDETSAKVRELVSDAQGKGINIVRIHRKVRQGFKAGALQNGLLLSQGEFLAIFDSDFLPEPDFLLKSIPQFANPKVGMVQSRWGHLNKNYSLLTKLQAFGLDAHFTIEQTGRHHAGSFINFNGTGGIWRKECILDAGGWSADTLTEDLDLSYRAQIKGWKFNYLQSLVSPAELPVIMSAVKTQQFRWNKGAAETARKNLSTVLKSGAKLTTKLHAIFHLLNSSVFLFLLLASILSFPLLIIKNNFPEINLLFNIGSAFLLGFLSIGIFYWISNKEINPKKSASSYIRIFPQFLILMMGLSLHNSLAVIHGLIGRKTSFIRTPKFNVVNPAQSWKANSYINRRINLQTIIEGLLAFYFLTAIAAGVLLNDFDLVIFHLMMASGFLAVFILSIKSIVRNA